MSFLYLLGFSTYPKSMHILDWLECVVFPLVIYCGIKLITKVIKLKIIYNYYLKPSLCQNNYFETLTLDGGATYSFDFQLCQQLQGSNRLDPKLYIWRPKEKVSTFNQTVPTLSNCGSHMKIYNRYNAHLYPVLTCFHNNVVILIFSGTIESISIYFKAQKAW